MHEIEANKSYQLNDTEFKVGLTVDKTTELRVENEVKKGKIQIEKVDKDDTNIKIEGVIFNIINDRTNKVVDTITTNAEGIAITKPLSIFDTYTAFEIETNKKYELNTENIGNIEVPDNDIIKVQITNEKKKGQVRILKVDADNHDVLLEGVKFDILDKDLNYIETIVTNEKGEAVSSLLPTVDETYFLRETETNDLYELSNELKTITLTENKILDVIFENYCKTGSIKIIKVDKDNNEIPVKDATFEIIDEITNEVVDTVITDEQGFATVDNLKVTRRYTVHEISTDKRYNINTNDITNIVIKANDTIDLQIENEKKKGQFKVIKVDADNHEVLLEGVKFEVLDTDMNVIEELTTNEKGEAISSLLPCVDETYYIKETETNELYELSEELKTITLEENQIKDIVFENHCKTGSLRVIKVDKDNNELPVKDATFKVVDETTNEVVDTIVTNEQGFATIDNLKVTRKYAIYETYTNKKYNINPEEITNIVIHANSTTDIKVENEKKKGQVRVIKVDKDINEVLLEGVKFEILDSNMNIIEELSTNENGEAISSLLPCVDETYFIREKESLETYVLNEEIKTITLEENQIKDITFENEKVKGYLEITKVDAKDNNIKLKDAEFGIYNENNELVQTLKTNEQGIATSDLLVIGKYYLKELSSGSVYYLLNEDTFEFEIVKNHETVSVVVENEPVDIEVTVDKEGDVETRPGEIVHYTFSNIANASNTYLDSFKWFDYIPTDATRIELMTTGTWNQDLTYNIYYKTNKSKEYVLYKENLNTKENYNIDFTTIKFAKDEYITEFYFDFGKVDIGFKEDIAPTLECRALDTLENNSTFTNYTKTVGNFYGIEAESNSKWTTIVHIPEKPEPVLPRTGK